MHKQILIALLGLTLLAGCSDDTSSPAKFSRGKRYLCATGEYPQPNTAQRYCAADFTTPISGEFTYRNKLGETLIERYADGYIVHAVHLDAPLVELSNRTTGGLKTACLCKRNVSFTMTIPAAWYSKSTAGGSSSCWFVVNILIRQFLKNRAVFRN